MSRVKANLITKNKSEQPAMMIPVPSKNVIHDGKAVIIATPAKNAPIAKAAVAASNRIKTIKNAKIDATTFEAFFLKLRET
jgi:hypothetical protein